MIDRLLQLLPPAALQFVYGSTERLGVVTMTGAEWAEHRGAAGRPQDVELSIRDADRNEVPPGEVGEIHMRPLDPTRRLFRYLGAPTPEPTADGFRTIGDLGWLDEHGYLFIADRRTDLIITGGANVFPAEVEAALSEHPGVADQVVVPVPDPDWGHRVHAIIEPADPANPPRQESCASSARRGSRRTRRPRPSSSSTPSRARRRASSTAPRSARPAPDDSVNPGLCDSIPRRHVS